LQRQEQENRQKKLYGDAKIKTSPKQKKKKGDKRKGLEPWHQRRGNGEMGTGGTFPEVSQKGGKAERDEKKKWGFSVLKA